MVDITQFVLIFVVVSLTIVLLIIGFHTINILKELKNTIIKVNKILDDTGQISESVAKPMSSFSGFLLGLKSSGLVSAVVQIIKRRSQKKEE